MIGRIIIGVIALIVIFVIIGFLIKIIASILIGLIVLAIVVVGGWWIYKKFIKNG
ncbi:MAG: hypothetical protein H0X50_03715 [Nitrosopumilus sp.]|nr:hypothetical protein [Nitrosopumilus sp.]